MEKFKGWLGNSVPPETIRMIHQIIFTAVLAWLALYIQNVNAEVHAHTKDIAAVQVEQHEVIIRIDGDIQEIRAALARIEDKLDAVERTENRERR